MADGHYRHNRRTRNLIKTLRQSRSNAVRQKILEELKREFDRMSQYRWGKALKRGAIGIAKWGRRTGQAAGRGAAATKRAAGNYARNQARQREATRPQREAERAKKRDARAQQRQTRARQRATRAKQRPGSSTRALANRLSQLRRGPANGNNTRPRAGQTQVSRQAQAARQQRAAQQARAGTTPRKPTARPAQDKRAARVAKGPGTAGRVTPAAKTARPGRTGRKTG